LAIEAVEFANVHSIYVRPNNSGFNLISGNYLSGGTYLPLSLSARENNSDFVLQTNGNVLIGTTTDAGYKLDVNGTGRFSGNLQVTTTGSTRFTMSGTDNGILLNDTTAASTARNWGVFTSSAAEGDFVIQVGASQGAAPSSNVLYFTSTGAATFSSSVTATSIIRSGGTSSQFLKADGSVDSNAYITGNQTITLSGDATGSGTTAITVVLANSGVIAGTYNNSATQVRPFTVDVKGRITSIGTAVTITPAFSDVTGKPTTLAGYGITDAYTQAQVNTLLNGKQNALSGTGFVKISGTTISYDNSTYYLASNPSAFIALTALSGTAPIQYNNTTGAISITQASGSTNGFLSSTDWNTFNNKTSNVGTVTSVAALTLGTAGSDLSSTVANGTTTPVITLNVPTASAANRGALSAADWTTFNGKENAIVAGTTAQYYRGDKTFQTLNTAAVPEVTNLYYTEARVNANTNVAANTAARHNAVTLGTANGLSLSTQQLSLGLASSSANGALSSTDWTTFNNKQNALTNPVTGTGTTNTLAKFTGSTTIGNSLLTDNGTNAGYNNAGVAARTFIIQATSGRPFALEVIENANVHAIYLYPNNAGFNRISSDYMSGGVFLPLSLTGRENNADLVLQTNGNVTIGTTTDAGYKLDVNGTGRFKGASASPTLTLANSTGGTLADFTITENTGLIVNSYEGASARSINLQVAGTSALLLASTGAATFSSSVTVAGTIPATSGKLSVLTSTSTLGATADLGLLISNDGSTGKLAQIGFGYSESRSAAVIGGIISNGGGSTTSDLFFATRSTTVGSTAPTERMRIFSDGNVFIGSSPSNAGYKLDVNGTGKFSGALQVASNITAVNGAMEFGGSGSAPSTDPAIYRVGGVNSLQFAIGSSPRMTITSGGNVGIGTTSVTTNKLVVEGFGTANSIMTYPVAKFYGAGSGGLNIGTDGTNPQIATDSSGVDLTFLTRVAGVFYERMRITSGGNVLIGTTSEVGGRLGIKSSGTNTAPLVIQRSANTNTLASILETSTGDASMTLSSALGESSIQLLSNGNSTFRGGNVLIGTSADLDDLLRVNGNTYTNTIRTYTPDLETRSVAWKLGASRGGTVTTNATVRVEIDGVLVDLVARYV
jgi:hypothetical protein